MRPKWRQPPRWRVASEIRGLLGCPQADSGHPLDWAGAAQRGSLSASGCSRPSGRLVEPIADDLAAARA